MPRKYSSEEFEKDIAKVQCDTNIQLSEIQTKGSDRDEGETYLSG